MMKLTIGGIIYLALVFRLGTGAVVNVEQKLNEEKNIAAKAILEKMIEKVQVDRMFQNNVADIDTENNQVTTGESKYGDLQLGAVMSCSWRRNIGNCCSYLSYINRLCVQLSVSGSGMFIEASRNGYTFKQKYLSGSGTMTFGYVSGYLHLTLTVSVVRSSQNIKSCFRIVYNMGFRHYSANLGCNNKRWHSNEDRPVKNSSPNTKNPLELQGFDIDQLYNDGYLDVIADRRTLSEVMVKDLHSDRTVENNVANMVSQNEQSVIKGSEIGDLKVLILKCKWKKKAGHCSVLLENLPWLYVNMTVVPTGIHFQLQFGARPILDTYIYGVHTKIFNITLGPAQTSLQISVKNNTSHYIKVCFFMNYKVEFKSWSGSLGCPSKSFLTRKENNTLMFSMKDLNKNFQHPLTTEDFDPDKVLKKIKLKKPFILYENDVKQNEKL